MKIYRCPICGNVIELLDGDINHITCCGTEMECLEANEVEASLEKHIPVYETKDNEILVKVGSTIHPMEEEHYIMWIALLDNDKITKVKLNPNDEPKAKFPYIKNSEIYAYCNKHGLWKTKVN